MSFILYVYYLRLGVSHIVIPAGFFGDGSPYINGSIPSIIGTETVVQIGIIPNENGQAYIRGSEFSSIWMQNVTIDFAPHLSFIHDDFLLSVVSEGFESRAYQPVAALGISSGSFMIRRYESVDFLKIDHNNAFLVLNSALDWFSTRACAETTLISIPIIPSLLPFDQVHMSVAFESQAELSPLVFQLTTTPLLLTLPESVLNPILLIIQRQATYYDESGDSIVFTQCEEIITSHLPNLFLAVSSGVIRLSPSDYTRWIGNQTCELLIAPRANVSLSEPFLMNPFLLENINLRFTNSLLWLCDSISPVV